jgi:type II secretory pathway component PulK
MTFDLALAIVNWRDANINGSADGGAVDTDYQMLNPAYHCKNAPFESIEELRLVYGMDLETLFGEDANLNGVMDPNENDGDQSPPQDDSNGKLDPGLLEYVTVWTREPNSGLTNVNDAASLRPLLEEMLGSDRATQIIAAAQLSPTTTNGSSAPPIRSSTQRAYGSALDFFLASGMSSQEFAQIADYIVASTNNEPYTEGLININTASETVLGCIPGIGTNNASAVVAYRQSNGGGSVAWLVDAIGPEAARQAAPYVTSHSYQVCADIAALGHHGRGYKRMKYIFDTSDGGANILYRQDLTHLGWALGKDVRNKLLLTQN